MVYIQSLASIGERTALQIYCLSRLCLFSFSYLLISFFDSRKRVTSEVKDSIYSLLWNRLLQGVSKFKSKTLVSGHTPLQKTTRHKKEGVIQIDTGCYAGQRLTAWCPEADKVLFVRAKKRYF